MLFKYSPEGAEPRVWTFDPARLMSSEAEAIERVTRVTYREFGGAIQTGSVGARHALLWVLLKRTEPTLRYEQVDFPTGTVELEYEAHELRELREIVEVNPDLTDQERTEGLNILDEQIADAEVEAPKANASSAASTD